jgi:uncharacterized membrane protein YhaH (DUF805 family)
MISYSQLKAMFLKRWHSFKRDWRMWLLLFFPTVIISIIMMYGLMLTNKVKESTKGLDPFNNLTSLNMTDENINIKDTMNT